MFIVRNDGTLVPMREPVPERGPVLDAASHPFEPAHRGETINPNSIRPCLQIAASILYALAAPSAP